MKGTPKSLRLQLGLFGRTNVGKSSFLNMIAGQDVAITSDIPGTTTDIVEKVMELLPVGPVVFLDTAGVDDTSGLAEKRIQKTARVMDRADIVLLVVEPNIWTEYEDKIVAEATRLKLPVQIIVNKIDAATPDEIFLNSLLDKTARVMTCSSIDPLGRDRYGRVFKQQLLDVFPGGSHPLPELVGDLLPEKGLAVLVTPIDLEAPKGRIKTLQVQTIRDALDHQSASLVVKESEYRDMLGYLRRNPDLVICDSPVIGQVAADTPADVPCTTFSVLFARYKGDLNALTRGLLAVRALRPGDKVLIAESCSHHPIDDDIGREKIPRWLSRWVGGDLDITVSSGRDFPADLSAFKVIIHCGSCMLTRQEMLNRIRKGEGAGVAVTNYGLCIALLQGVIERALQPFPEAFRIYQDGVRGQVNEVCHAD